MPRPAVVLIVVCGLGAAGCQSASSPDGTDTLIGNGSVTPLVHEVYTSFGEPARLVVREARLLRYLDRAGDVERWRHHRAGNDYLSGPALWIACGDHCPGHDGSRSPVRE